MNNDLFLSLTKSLEINSEILNDDVLSLILEKLTDSDLRKVNLISKQFYRVYRELKKTYQKFYIHFLRSKTFRIVENHVKVYDDCHIFMKFDKENKLIISNLDKFDSKSQKMFLEINQSVFAKLQYKPIFLNCIFERSNLVIIIFNNKVLYILFDIFQYKIKNIYKISDSNFIKSFNHFRDNRYNVFATIFQRKVNVFYDGHKKGISYDIFYEKPGFILTKETKRIYDKNTHHAIYQGEIKIFVVDNEYKILEIVESNNLYIFLERFPNIRANVPDYKGKELKQSLIEIIDKFL